MRIMPITPALFPHRQRSGPLQNQEIIGDGRTVWINAEDGICIGRFGRFGINVHHDANGQTGADTGTGRGHGDAARAETGMQLCQRWGCRTSRPCEISAKTAITSPGRADRANLVPNRRELTPITPDTNYSPAGSDRSWAGVFQPVPWSPATTAFLRT
jgi:hypothetical protein